MAMLWLGAFCAWSETYYWIGGTAGNWKDGNNWSKTENGSSAADAYPGADDTAVIKLDTTINMAAAVTVGSLVTDGTITLDKILAAVNSADIKGTLTVTGSEGDNPFGFCFYNKNGDVKTLVLRDGATINTLYTAGNVNISLEGDAEIGSFNIPDSNHGLKHSFDQSFEVILTGSGKLKVTEKFDIGRSSSSTTGVRGTFIADSNIEINCGFGLAQAHVGSAFVINEGKTVSSVRDFYVSSYSTEPLISIDVDGTFNIGTLFDLGRNNTACGQLTVGNKGVLSAQTIQWETPSYTAPGENPVPFTNNGIVNVTTALKVIEKKVDKELPLINNGTINVTGTTATLSAAYFTGTGTINFAGEKITASSTAAASKIKELKITDGSLTTVSGKFEIEKLVSEKSSLTFDEECIFKKFDIGSASLASQLIVTFPAGKTQTIGDISCTGSSSTNNVIMQSDTDGVKWNACFTSAPSATDFSYTVVKDSVSVDSSGSAKLLNISAVSSRIKDSSISPFSTENWFVYKFYWFGGTDTSWLEGKNWSIDGTTVNSSSDDYPDYENEISEIIIKDSSTKILNLGSGVNSTSPIKVKSITVNENQTLNIGTCSIEVSDTDAGITNNGKILLEGDSSQTITGNMFNGTDSTIEYYGINISNLVWDGQGKTSTAGNQFKNIVFASGSVANLTGVTEVIDASKNAEFYGEITSSAANKIGGTTLIANGNGKSFSFTGANTFTGNVTLGKGSTQAGKITINSDGSLKIAAGSKCESLDVQSSVNLLGSIESTSTVQNPSQLYEKSVILGGAVSLISSDTKITFNDTVNGENSLTVSSGSGDITFLGSVGAANSLTQLSLTSKGSINLNGGSVKTSGSQTYDGNVLLGADSELSAAGQNIFLKINVTGGTNSLIITGNPTFGTKATNTVSGISSLSVTGNTTVNSGSITTSGNQTYDGTFVSNNDLTINSADSTFKGAVSTTGDVIFNSSDVTFNGNSVSVSGNVEINLSASTNTATFSDSTAFTQTDSKNFEIKKGTVKVGQNKFDCGNLVIDAGTSFIQSGKNADGSENELSQSVSSIKNDGSCVWDSTSAGGTLTLNGDVSGVNALKTIFNKKNVTIGKSVELSGVFFDLTVPATINVTNGQGICVRRNLTVLGTYTHNSQTLTLGKIEIDGKNYSSGTSAVQPDGTISGIDTDFGKVTITQETTSKTFDINGTFSKLSLDDVTATAGKIVFEKNVTVTTLTNGTTNFDIDFNGSQVKIADNTDFKTSGNLVFGNEETDIIEFTNGLKISDPNKRVTLAGTLKNSTNGIEIAKSVILSQNETINSPTVKFNSTVDSNSAFSPRNLTLNVTASAEFTGNAGSSAVLGDITSTESACSNIFKGTVSSGKILINGNNEFGGDVNSISSIEIMGKNNFTKSTAQTVKSTGTQKYYGDITANEVSVSATGTDSRIEFFSINYNAAGNQTVSAPKGIFAYFDSDKIWRGSFKFADNLGLFGSKYNADDPRYSGIDTRFELFGYGPYTPAGSSSKLSGSSTTFKADKNFYANGLDIDDIKLQIPSNTESNPVFNSTSAVTERQWGIPYAAVFNSTLSNVVVSTGSTTGAYLIASTDGQNCVDGGNNENINFEMPRIVSAYSVYDDVICIEFNMPIENSHNEIRENIKNLASSSLASGGIWYKNKVLRLGEDVYTDADCTMPLPSNSDVAGSGTENPKIYIRTSNEKWNTDADGNNAFNTNGTKTSDSTDRNGIHHEVTIDLSLLEGTFTAANGHTMNQNYGIGLENGSSAPSYTATEDRCAPVLIAVYSGQELHSDYVSDEADQPFYDSHNFLEFQYSEAVNVYDMKADCTDTFEGKNRRADQDFGHITSSGGLTVSGLGKIENGALNAFSKDSSTLSPHALYRNFPVTAGAAAEKQSHRIRVSVAGYVDGTVALEGFSSKNWVGCIRSAASPSGTVTRAASTSIKDTGKNSIVLAHTGTEHHPLPALTLNAWNTASRYASSLYGSWDTVAPEIAPFIKDEDSWKGNWDLSEFYEIVGTTTGNYIENIELHLFDNNRTSRGMYTEWWRSKAGWNQTEIPDVRGGARPFATGNTTSGGIRRSSLVNANSAFSYVAISDSVERPRQTLNSSDITQTVRGTIFDKTSISKNDGGYLSLPINPSDAGILPVRTTFNVTYNPSDSYITDLAGNLLSSSYTGTKSFSSIDLTPPSFVMTLAPIGHNKLYAVFTKRLAAPLSDGSRNEYLNVLDATELNYAMERIRERITVSSNPVQKVEFVSGNNEYTALLFTLSDAVKLSDVISEVYLEATGKDTVKDVTDLTVTDTGIQDYLGNYLAQGKKHIISDFALNAVNVLYGHAHEKNDDNWDDQNIYGTNLPQTSSGYTVHDFSANQGNYGSFEEGRDITLQVQLVEGLDTDGKFIPSSNSFTLVASKKSALKKEMISSSINRQTGVNWRVWLPTELKSLATAANDSVISANPVVEEAESLTPSLLWNYTFHDNIFNFKAGEEIQFVFCVDVPPIDHDGDPTTDSVPLYALWMPENLISSGNFNFIDLWSFRLKDIKKQRGGVSILNNVINVNVREQSVIKVDMKEKGNLNVYVMTLDGNIVKRLSKGQVAEGTHYFRWDGTNNSGKAVARGLYFVRVTGPGIDETRKIMCVKD